MDALHFQPNYLTWLLGQSVAVVVLLLWVWTLSRAAKASAKRNEKLQDDLIKVVENASSERLRAAGDQLLQHDSTVRNMLLSLERGLALRRNDSEECFDDDDSPRR